MHPHMILAIARKDALGDVLLGKLLVTLAYQLVISVGVMALLGGFGGTIPLLLLYILLGTCLALALGLLFGVLFQTANVVVGLSVLIFFIPPSVIVPLAPFISSNPITNLVKILPTYYLADGANNAIQHVGSFSSNLAGRRRDPGDHAGYVPDCLLDDSPSGVRSGDHLVQ